MRTILTILDGITETSMPFNEFVLYRANHFKDENHVLIVCNKKTYMPSVEIPTNLNIIYVGKNLRNIRKTIKTLLKKYDKENIKYLIHMHQVKSAFLAQLAMIGTSFRKKVIFTVHSTFSGYSLHNKILSFVNAILANRITCVSNSSYSNYPRLIKKIKKDKIQAIQNGVDLERIDKVRDINGAKDNKYVDFIYVARIIPIKNHTFLINVLKRTNNNVRLVLVGNDSKAESIKELCKRYNLENRVIFTGLIPRNEVFRKIQEADVYISSSTLEGLPISVLEAAYCGLPVIISDIPQHRELADENKFISVLPFDENIWVKEINKLVNLGEIERKLIGKQCKEYVKNNFSLKKMHENYENIYIQML